MLELTVDNALDFCRQRGWIGAEPARAELLSGGVSNAVLRIESGGQLFVLKQSRPQLRTRDAWFSDIRRIWREMEVMTALAPHLPAGVVPQVLHHDREHFAFLMSHAPREAQVWKEQLLAGEVRRELAVRAGTVLGMLHEVSASRPEFRTLFLDRTVFEQLRVEPFYLRVQERRPEVAEAVAPWIEELRTRDEALCHGDFSPKNILAHGNDFMLVDYETAHRGDPSMDLGFFLSHLLLKACRDAERRGAIFDLTRGFWQGYGQEIRFRSLSELQARGSAHLGVCLLARIDGTSPVHYLPQESRREAVRCLARSLLLRPPADWETVLERAEDEFGRVP
jgi:5-methylthioribose kinase